MKQQYSPNPQGKTSMRHNILFHAAAAVLFTVASTGAFAASQFEGTLDSVTISDAAGTNSPPSAALTYTLDGGTITLDASGSTDTDGTIVTYKWTFGDGTTAEGQTATYTAPEGTAVEVTLTVVDDKDGVAIVRESISSSTPPGGGIFDDFSTDTSGDYIVLSGGLNIIDGAAYSSSNWTTGYFLHSTDLGSNDHSVEADVYYDGNTASAGVLFRFNQQNNTGYIAKIASGRIILAKYTSGSEGWVAQAGDGMAAGMFHVKATVIGNNISLYVNDTLLLERTDTTYPSGSQVGLRIYPYGKASLIKADNLQANVM